jgi:hypothetical protein
LVGEFAKRQIWFHEAKWPICRSLVTVLASPVIHKAVVQNKKGDSGSLEVEDINQCDTLVGPYHQIGKVLTKAKEFIQIYEES